MVSLRMYETIVVCRFATLQSPQKNSSGPSGLKLETELKMSSRGLPASGPKKVIKSESKRVKKVEISTLFQHFDSFWTRFSLFGSRGRKAPRTHFQLRFQLWARRAQKLLWGDSRVAILGGGLDTKAASTLPELPFGATRHAAQ